MAKKNKAVLYIVYHTRYERTGFFKKKYHRYNNILAIGVFSGKVSDLLDHYWMDHTVLFECLIPGDDMRAYLNDTEMNYPFEYDRFTNMLMELNSTHKYDSYEEEYLLNKFCLTKYY